VELLTLGITSSRWATRNDLPFADIFIDGALVCMRLLYAAETPSVGLFAPTDTRRVEIWVRDRRGYLDGRLLLIIRPRATEVEDAREGIKADRDITMRINTVKR
jgi:hypothetical protein